MAKAQVRDFLADRREITIGEADDPDPVRVVYRPGTFTPEFQRSVRKLVSDENSDHKIAVYTICTAVVSWNLEGPLSIMQPVLDRKGSPIIDDYGVPQREEQVLVPAGTTIPIDSQHVRHLNNGLLFTVMRAIQEDMDPSDPKSSS